MGGEFNITFEQRNEAVARLDKALGQLFLKNYPIIPVFRRMRHGGSVYDVERKVSGASEDLGQIIYYWEEGQDEELKDEFKNFLSTLQANYVGFQKLIREPSINLELKIEKSTILKWEDGLKHNLEIFRKTRNDFNALVENAGRHNLSVDMRDTIGTFSEMAKNQLDEIIHILEQGADLINGVVVAEEIDLGETIKEAIKSHGSYVEYKESPGLTIFADSMMVQQIITNILFNIDNIKTEKEITRVVIAARLSEDWKNVIIEIIDNGLGFPEEMLSKTPRSDGSYEVIFGLNMTYRKGGSGFGLAENDFYAMLNNGSFRVFSRPSGNHGGSTFTIKLPVVLSPEKQRVDSAFFESKETEPEIIEKMKQSISSLTELWRSYPPKAAYMNSALLTAEQILVLFFGGDVISNNLAVIRLYLQSYEQRKKRGEVAVEIEENKIRDRFETCDKIITRYDNILLEKLQDDTLINNYITYLFEHPVYNSGRITEEGIIDMDNLKPEQIRHIIQRYINDLKPVVESLKIDFDKLMQVIHEEIPNIDSAKKNQTSL